MFTKVCIENYEGILNRIELNFVAKSRNKENQICLYKTHDGVYINKLIGILAGNASGKTSIINALGELGSIMSRPIFNFNLEEEKKYIKKMIKDDNFSNKEFQQYIENLNNSVYIENQHSSIKEKNTHIEVEMYIEDEELPGYYNYIIEYNGITKKIVTEKFYYREKFKSKKFTNIIDLHNISECQLYYINKYYDNMINIEMINKQDLENKYKYIRKFFKHYIYDSKIVSTDLSDIVASGLFLKFFKENKNLMEQIIKIVDPKINNIKKKTDNDEEELIYTLKTGGSITREKLSKGTKRFLSLVINALNVINKKGVLLIDEIEQNLHKELIYLILRIFVQFGKNSTQIIFTTNLPEIFDCLNEDEKKVFKQDSIFLLNNNEGIIETKKMSDIKINNKRIKGDALVSTMFKKEKVVTQPNKEKINQFLREIK